MITLLSILATLQRFSPVELPQYYFRSLDSVSLLDYRQDGERSRGHASDDIEVPLPKRATIGLLYRFQTDDAITAGVRTT